LTRAPARATQATPADLQSLDDPTMVPLFRPIAVAAAALCLCLCLVAGPALALDPDSPIGGSFGAGLSAPVLLPLPLLGLLAVGLYAGVQAGRQEGQVVALALVSLLAGGLLHQGGIGLPHMALVRQGTLVVFGGLVALGMPLPRLVGLLLAVAAGLAQGMGLSAWVGAPGNPWLFWPGLAAGAALVLSGGIGLVSMLVQAFSLTIVRVAGAGLALGGLLLLLNVI